VPWMGGKRRERRTNKLWLPTYIHPSCTCGDEEGVEELYLWSARTVRAGRTEVSEREKGGEKGENELILV
jgi:hypothetical protein